MKKQDMLDLAKHVYKNYKALSAAVPFWQVLSIIDRNPEKVVFIKDDKKFLGGAFYLTVTDNTLDDIVTRRVDITNGFDMQRLISENGGNIHFIYVVADSVGTILRGIRKVSRNFKPKTISWFNPDMKFRMIRGLRCRQSQLSPQ